MRDPLGPPRGAANLGAASLGRTHDNGEDAPLWELGDVVAYSSATHTSTVRTHSGRPLKNVPQIRSTAGGFDHLNTGTTVVVFWGLGFPAILGCIDMVGPQQTAIPAPTLTGVEGVGDADPTQALPGTNNYKPPGAPTDMAQGDWAQVGSFGHHLAVLEGGVTSMGSPAAGVKTLATTGTILTVARRLLQLTDFGQLKVENDQGRTSLTLRAGSNQTKETGLDEQHWTIRMDLGATGDIFDFNITEPDGKLLFRLHAGSDGRVQIYGDGGVDLSSGAGGTGTMRQDVVGDRTHTVTGDASDAIQGGRTATVDGDAQESVGGDAVRSVSGHDTTLVSKDRDVGVAGDDSWVVSGKQSSKVGGDREVTVDGSSKTKAGTTLTTEAPLIKHGENAADPVIKGMQFQTSVMSQIMAAGSALSAGGAAAISSISPDTATGTPTTATVATVAAIAAVLSAVGALLTAAASAYPSTLSRKVNTE